MIQATITISLSEFTPGIIEKIKELLDGNGEEAEIIISIRPKRSSFLRKETREAYFARLERSIAESKAGHNLVSFENVEELEQFI